MNLTNSLQTIVTIAVAIGLALVTRDQTRDTAKLQQIDAYVTETRARTEILEHHRTTATETLDQLRDDIAMLRRDLQAHLDAEAPATTPEPSTTATMPAENPTPAAVPATPSAPVVATPSPSPSPAASAPPASPQPDPTARVNLIRGQIRDWERQLSKTEEQWREEDARGGLKKTSSRDRQALRDRVAASIAAARAEIARLIAE